MTIIEDAPAGVSLDPAIKALWIDELLSGEYKQGRGALRSTEDEFCCLGVLCNIVGPAKWGNPSAHFGFDGEDSLPPAWVLDRVGLDSASAELLANMNDERKWSFVTIAEWIEENL